MNTWGMRREGIRQAAGLDRCRACASQPCSWARHAVLPAPHRKRLVVDVVGQRQRVERLADEHGDAAWGEGKGAGAAGALSMLAGQLPVMCRCRRGL